jgi:hypothetical protein
MANAGPRGTILGAWVGEYTNVSASIGIATPRGVILGEEVGGETVAHACTGTTGPRSVIPGADSMVGGGAFAVGGASGFVCFPDHSPLAYGPL